MSTEILVETLGTVAIDVGGRRLGPSAGRPFALLLYLASRRGQPSSRRIVQDLLFPLSMRERSAHSLRQLLYRLRQLALPVDADDDQVWLAVDHVSVDWLELLNAGVASEADLERLARGLFPGYSPDISESFRDWLDAERTEVALRLSRVLTRQLAELRRAGQWTLVDATARALLALDPLSEEGTLAKAEALAVSGSKSAALGVLDGYMEEVGPQQRQLQLLPSALKRRISERLPDEMPRAGDDRMFVGREESMRMLSALGIATRAGNQQVILLWGEPGVGKTRLVAEYRAFASLQGTFTVSLSCQPHDVFRPLGILCDLVVELLIAPGSLGCDPGARLLLQRLVTVNKQIDGAREAMVSQVSIAAVVRSLSDLISAIALESPLQIFIDDAQWIDENSHTAIIGAFAGRTPRRSSLVLTSRERTILAGSAGYVDSVVSARLNPLDRDAALALAHGLLAGPRRANADATSREVVEQARGNPFVIRMLCAHYLETNDSESLKHTLTEILARRLERLPSDARHALEASVVLAKNCTFERLERLLEMSRQQLLGAIEELDAQGLIDVTDGYVVNSHALLAEAVRERMAASVLRLLHGAAAQLLHRDVDTSARGALMWDCAEHWRQAGNDDHAIAVWVECAERAVASGRATDALLTLRRALSLEMPDERRLSIVERALSISWRSHVHVDARQLLSELARLRRALGHPERVHDDCELLETALLKHDGPSSDVRKTIPQLRACISAADASPWHRVGAAHHLMILGELMLDADASHFAFGLRSEYDQISDAELVVAKRAGFDMIYHGTFGDPECARAEARRVIAWAMKSPESFPMLINAAILQYRVAPPHEAEATLRLALERARQYEFAFAETNVGVTLARLFWSTERLEECVTHHRLLSCQVAQCKDPEVIVDYHILGARLATVHGQHDAVAAHLRKARALPHAQMALPDLLLRCCELELRLATGNEPVPNDELNALLALHRRARGFGLQDEVMAAVLKCLDRNGRSDEGTRLLHEYLRDHRRDGFPVPSWLASRIDARQPEPSVAFSLGTRLADRSMTI